ncbi:hypothetical protein QUF76_11585 [Desulfobacterales bacterium HSG16]|nr:hypothetical protein [Desulfobacterales bacterium HSG16]
MQQLVTIEIPREWMQGLPDEELTYKHIVRLGIKQAKNERAIQLYRDGVGSLGYISEKMGLAKQDLIREMKLRNIEPDFSEETVQEELMA